MYSDDDMVMLSALQHYVFCPRQCALIHLEGVWSENYLTAAGRVLHEHVDSRGSETRRDLRQATSVRIVSHRLGLIGIADMLEFHRAGSAHDLAGVCTATRLSGLSLFWTPFPVEYKRGRPKGHRADEVQLCAQAICLEEMLHVTVSQGALFYGETRRRMDVRFDSMLRTLTQSIADSVHKLYASGITPSAEYGKRCESCSILEQCQPRMFGRRLSAAAWLDHAVKEATK